MQILLDCRTVPAFDAETVVLWQFSDEQLLTGVNAAIDQQLGGALSRLMAAASWRADSCAKLLCASKLKPEASVLLVGLGTSDLTTPDVFAAAMHVAVNALRSSAASVATFTLPCDLDLRTGAAQLLEILAAAELDCELRVICAPAEQEDVLSGLQQTKVKLKRDLNVSIAVRL